MIRLLSLALLLLGSILFASAMAAGDDAAGWTAADMLKVKRVGVVQPSPDGELAAYTVRQAIVEEGKSE